MADLTKIDELKSPKVGDLVMWWNKETWEFCVAQKSNLTAAEGSRVRFPTDEELASIGLRKLNIKPPKPIYIPRATHSDSNQKLVDICFEIGLTVGDEKFEMFKKTRDELAAWIATQLDGCGFKTRPCGASWGVLLKDNIKNRHLAQEYSRVVVKEITRKCNHCGSTNVVFHDEHDDANYGWCCADCESYDIRETSDV